MPTESILKDALGPTYINFKIFCLKTLTEGTLHEEWSKLFHLIIVEGQNCFKFFFCFILNKGMSLVLLKD